MFYQICQEDRVISKHKARRDAFEAVAQDLDHRTLRSVKYQGTVLTTIHEFSRDEVESWLRKLHLRVRAAGARGAGEQRSIRSLKKTATDVPL